MSSHGVGLGPSKKGRTADSSMVTRNIKIVAQGQADATYADQQKKNPFRLSSAILNEEAYNSQVLGRRNMQNAVPPAVGPPEPVELDLFSPFNVADWQLNNGYSSESTDPVGITMMTAGPFVPNSDSPRSSSFYLKSQLDLTRSFTLAATFLTKTAGNPPLDGFAVAISASPFTFGGNGGNMGIFGSSTPYVSTPYPVLGVLLRSLSPKRTFIAVGNTVGSPPSGFSNDIPSIAQNITDVDDLEITVTIFYDSIANTMTWIIADTNDGSATTTYTAVDMPRLLNNTRGYIGVGAGAGAALQPVFLIGMTLTQ